VAEPARVPTGTDVETSSEAWMEHGRCAGKTHLFFPPLAERPQARVRREAKAARICAECPVLVECRLFARLNREHGFWGGESEEERIAAGYALPAPIGGRSRRPSLHIT
jgi:WhiB family redox-sensing transcriptional regulator